MLTLGEEELHKIWLSETSRHDNEENDPEDGSVSKQSSSEVQSLIKKAVEILQEQMTSKVHGPITN